jgi:hypothetical protein
MYPVTYLESAKMSFFKLSRLLGISTLILMALSIMGSTSQSDISAQASTATPAATCGAALLPTEAATGEPTLESTAEATQDANAPIQYVSFTPTDIHFNPNQDKPFALITVYSLIFQSQLSNSLHIEKPQFELAINGVPWGTLASTDFRTGQLLPHATQGIVLQNLTIISKTTPAQQAILDCLKMYQPVDLTLAGTIDAYPNGKKQSVAVTLTTRQVVLREHKQP